VRTITAWGSSSARSPSIRSEQPGPETNAPKNASTAAWMGALSLVLSLVLSYAVASVVTDTR
jgi:hypothetical protein